MILFGIGMLTWTVYCWFGAWQPGAAICES